MIALVWYLNLLVHSTIPDEEALFIFPVSPFRSWKASIVSFRSLLQAGQFQLSQPFFLQRSAPALYTSLDLFF